MSSTPISKKRRILPESHSTAHNDLSSDQLEMIPSTTSHHSTSFDPTRPSFPVQLIINLALSLNADKDISTLLSLQRVSKEGYKVTTRLFYDHVHFDKPEKFILMFKPVIQYLPILFSSYTLPPTDSIDFLGSPLFEPFDPSLEPDVERLTRLLSSRPSTGTPGYTSSQIPVIINPLETDFPLEWVDSRYRRILRSFSHIKSITLDFLNIPNDLILPFKWSQWSITTFFVPLFPNLDRMEITQKALQSIPLYTNGQKTRLVGPRASGWSDLAEFLWRLRPKHICISQASPHDYDPTPHLAFLNPDGSISTQEGIIDGRILDFTPMLMNEPNHLKSFTIHSWKMDDDVSYIIQTATRCVEKVRVIFPFRTCRTIGEADMLHLGVAVMNKPLESILEIQDSESTIEIEDNERLNTTLGRLSEYIQTTPNTYVFEIVNGAQRLRNVEFLLKSRGPCVACQSE
ncbi:hypothetical protein M231_04131 [Tremella mesenterica]|uniref:Uncharacterized protein n=1 Tax=Tremella mesenterica TaxID=5217 RepID=A0A4Q1BLG1_TREME|nr:hypothetical protein M231_04131 [Tremella mesenterica]